MGEHARSSQERLSPWENPSETAQESCIEMILGLQHKGGEGMGQGDPRAASYTATRWVMSSSCAPARGSTWRWPWSMSSISRRCWGNWAAPATYSHVPSSCGERVVRALVFARRALAKRFPPSWWQNCYFLTSVLCLFSLLYRAGSNETKPVQMPGRGKKIAECGDWEMVPALAAGAPAWCSAGHLHQKLPSQSPPCFEVVPGTCWGNHKKTG